MSMAANYTSSSSTVAVNASLYYIPSSVKRTPKQHIAQFVNNE